MNESLLPMLKRSIADFLYEEEGNITRNKVLTVGSMVLIMGIILSTDLFAAHGSHSSHKSHSSHSSHSSSSYHSSHSSHSNTQPAHSNVVPAHSNSIPSTIVGTKVKPLSATFGTAQTTPSVNVPEVSTPTLSLPDTPKIR